MKHLLILLTGMNRYAACSLIRSRNILSSVGPTRSCWPTREPSPSFCKLTPRKTTHPTHQVTRAAILDIRREGWVISKKQNILRAYLYRTKNNAHDHCRKKNSRTFSEPKKACYTEKIVHAHTSPNVAIRKKRLFFGQVMGKIFPHQFSSRPGESDRGLGATY